MVAAACRVLISDAAVDGHGISRHGLGRWEGWRIQMLALERGRPWSTVRLTNGYEGEHGRGLCPDLSHSATLVLAIVREACPSQLRLSPRRHDTVIMDSRRESIQIAEEYQT